MKTWYNSSGLSLYPETKSENELLKKLFEAIPQEDKGDSDTIDKGFCLMEMNNGDFKSFNFIA